MRKKPNPKVFLGLMGLTFVAGAGLTWMQYNALGDVQSKVDKLRAEAKDESEVKKELETQLASLDDTKTKLMHLEQGVTEVAYVPTMLKELEAEGTKAGMQVLGVRPIPVAVKPTMKPTTADDTPKEHKPYTEMAIEVRGRGSYHAVLTFLRALQMFPKIVGSRTVSVQPKTGVDSDRNKPPMLDVTIELRSYVFAEKPAKKDGKEQQPEDKTINLSGRNKMAVN